MAKILIVEDNHEFLESLTHALKAENHVIESVIDGAEGLHRLLVCNYDLAIIDWMLPGIQGIEICRRYREEGGETLILMLTGRFSVADREAGLEQGADDYLTKPFSFRELTARVRGLLRRSGSTPGEHHVLKAADIEVNTASCQVTKAGQEVSLTGKEYALLELFLRHPKRVF